MKTIRILYIIASADIGGAENFIYALLTSLNNAKFEKYVVCPDGSYYTEKFEALAKKTLFINPKRSFMNLGTVLQVSKFIKENNIDIVHSMLYTSSFCAILARFLSGRACVLNTINGFDFLILQKYKLRLKRRIASHVYRVIYRFSDQVVAVSESVRQDLISRRGIKVEPEKVKTILTAGVRDSYHDFQKQDIEYLRAKCRTLDELIHSRRQTSPFMANSKAPLSINPEQAPAFRPGCVEGLIFSAIGTLNESKDYDTMLEAFSMALRNGLSAKLLIAGDGPDKERLQKKACDLGLTGKAYFLGALEERRKNALLYMTDVFIMSSRSEGCPTVLLEAMYFEKPVMATAVGGIPEVVKNGETGLLTTAKNPQEMADAILDLTHNHEKRTLFGREGKKRFFERFTQQYMLEAYENIYDALLKKKFKR